VFAAHSGEDALLMGKHLPATPRGQRYWGKNLLISLGYRPQPGLPERELLAALGVREDEIGLLRLPHAEASEDEEASVLELLPVEAFEPLTRAGIRLALKEFARP
jgi:MoxR-vWA-beta-propeller ternary system protein